MILSQSPLSPRSPGNDGYSSGYELAQLKRKDLFTQRKQREFIPDNKKDDSYWDRRRRNNEAAKRSREKRRYNDMVLEQRVVELTKENHVLKAQLEAIKDKYNICGENLVSVDQIMATLPTSEQVLSITKRAKLTNTVPPAIIYPQSPSPVPTSVIHQSISLDSPTSPLQQVQQSSSNQQNKSSLASQQQSNALPHLAAAAAAAAASHHHFRSCQTSPPQPENGYRENGDNYPAAPTNSVLHTSSLHNSNGSTNSHHHLHHHHHHHPHLAFTSSPSVAVAAAAAAVVAQTAGATGILSNGAGSGSQSSAAVAALAASNICYANGAVSVIGGGQNTSGQINDLSSTSSSPYDTNNCNGNVLNLSRRGGGATSPYEMSSGTGSGAASGDDEQCDTTPSSINDINNSLPLKLRHKSHLGDKDAATALLALQHIKQEPNSRASPPWDGEGSSDERDSGISIGTEWTLHQRKIIVPTSDKEENIHLKSQIARLESEVANIKNMMILNTTAGTGATAAAQ